MARRASASGAMRCSAMPGWRCWRSRSMSCAWSRSRGCSKTRPAGYSRDHCRQMRAASRTAARELPPCAKKLASPAGPCSASPPSTSRHRPASVLVVGSAAPASCGAWLPPPAKRPDSNTAQASSVRADQPWRQAARCSLPLEVRGKAPGLSSTITVGASPHCAPTAVLRASTRAWAGTSFCMPNETSAAMPMPSRPSMSTANAATRPLRTASTSASTTRSMSCG